MKPDTPLDSVVFQLNDARTRCELWITAGESSERLASGSLMPFSSHLQTVQEQLARGADIIRLHASPCPIAQGSPWFTKRTIERFVRFVSTPDVLERVTVLETERLKLAEANNILISESPQADASVPNAGPATPKPATVAGSSIYKHGVDTAAEAQQTHPGGSSLDCLEIEAETSKRHLVNAMDARRLILEKEQKKAFARAAAAGFNIDSLSDLVAFADCFGATRFREACLNFSALHKRMQDAAIRVDELDFEPTSLGLDMQDSGIWLCGSESGLDSHIKAKAKQPDMVEEKADSSLDEGKVKNYGRRRVWGPPVVEIPQMSLESANAVPHSNGQGPLECKEVAYSLDESESPQRSMLYTGAASPSHEADWEDTENSENSNGIYAAQQETKDSRDAEVFPSQAANEGIQSPDDDIRSSKQVRGSQQSKSQTEQSAVQRKGIVVIRNVNFPQNEASAKKSEKHSDTESDNSQESENGKRTKTGRLSVQDAISLFESKQKSSRLQSAKQENSDVKIADRRRGGSFSQDHVQDSTPETTSNKKKEALKLNSHDKNVSEQGNGKLPLNSNILKQEYNMLTGNSSAVDQIKCGFDSDVVRTSRSRESLQNCGKYSGLEDLHKGRLPHTAPVISPKVNSEKPGELKYADDISKQLLDRSYSCLLKINSVVQDALSLKHPTLEQPHGQAVTKKLDIAESSCETECESMEWRSLSNTSAYGLDDMFIDSRVPITGSTRRQSLCTPAEYDSKNVELNTRVHSRHVQTFAPGASPNHQKGRLYDQYQEIREAKYKRESILMKSEREAKLRAMQEVLERRKKELLGKNTRLPEKNGTLSAEQMRGVKVQAMKNSILMANEKEARYDNVRTLQSEKPATRRTTLTNPLQPLSVTLGSQKQESPNPRMTTARKASPGLPKASTATPRSSARTASSPRSKNSNGSVTTISQRRVPNSTSQSVTSGSLYNSSIAPQAEFRKENAKPSLGRNSLNSSQDIMSFRYSQSKGNGDQVSRTSVMPLENRVASSQLRLANVDDKKQCGTGRKGVSGAREKQVLAPLRIARDMAAEQRESKYEASKSQGRTKPVVSSKTPRAPDSQSFLPSVKMQIPRELKNDSTIVRAPRQVSSASPSTKPISVQNLKDEVSRSNEECIKQIVSCVQKRDLREQNCGQVSEAEACIDAKEESFRFTEPSHGILRSSSDIRYDASSSKLHVGSLSREQLKADSYKEQLVPETNYAKPEELYSSNKQCGYETSDHKDFEEDMQIDEALEKCMSGRSCTSLEGISASPLTSFEATGTEDWCPGKQELNSSLSTGPSSQSLPHLQRSLSPTVSALRNDPSYQQQAADAKESKALSHSKEQHQLGSQPTAQKDQSKGFKRLLKFGRKNRASESTVAEWSTINEDANEPSCRSRKALAEESSSKSSGSTSSVRRSLEALPKIADAASELSARNFFSTFRSKSSAK